MHEKLNNKRCLRLVTTTQTSPLTLNERLVYSALLTHSDGLSQESVSSNTGLDAKGTVAAALRILVGHGLAKQQGHRWVALEPEDERAKWFSPGVKAEDWRRRIAYTKLYMRAEDCPLTLRQNVIFSLLLSLAQKSSKREDLPKKYRGRVCDKLTFEYLSLLSGVGVKTVAKTIDLLAGLKLARSFPSTDRSRFALVLLEPSDEALSWFLDTEVEVYPGLIEFLGAMEVELSAAHHEDASPVAVAEPITQGDVGHRKAAKRSKAPSQKSTPQPKPQYHPEEFEQRVEPEILPPVPDARLDSEGIIGDSSLIPTRESVCDKPNRA